MTPIPFYKLSGSGNDFIIIDNRTQIVNETTLAAFVSAICSRKMSVGADGVILVENSDAADFRWRFFNSDGSAAEMCGNGARCVARFAYENQIAGSEMKFETQAGLIEARLTGRRVKVKMTDPKDLILNRIIELEKGPLSISSLHTGVPHGVVITDDPDKVPVGRLGREIRFHKQFAPAGTNVNFASVKDGTVINRTYERGVEDETLACGTGCVAAALVISIQYGMNSPINVQTRGGEYLTIYFNKVGESFQDVFLEGDTRMICRGELLEDSWRSS